MSNVLWRLGGTGLQSQLFRGFGEQGGRFKASLGKIFKRINCSFCTVLWTKQHRQALSRLLTPDNRMWVRWGRKIFMSLYIGHSNGTFFVTFKHMYKYGVFWLYSTLAILSLMVFLSLQCVGSCGRYWNVQSSAPCRAVMLSLVTENRISSWLSAMKITLSQRDPFTCGHTISPRAVPMRWQQWH